MTKRIIAVFLAVLMVVAVATGCGKKYPRSSFAYDRTPDKNWQRTAEKSIDLGGRVVKFRGHYGVLDQYKAPATGDPSNPADKLQKRIKDVETRFNLKFEFVSENTSGWRVIADFNTKAAAGEKWSDIVWNMSRMAFPLQVTKNLVIPIDDYFDFVNDPIYNSKYLRTVAEWEGKIYGLGSWPIAQPDLGMFYNKSMVDSLGLEDPISLYNKGHWTWDEFTDYAIKATADTNGDGKVDRFGINGDSASLYQALLSSNGADVVSSDGSGSYKLAIDSPASVNVLKKIVDLISNFGVVKKDTFFSGDDKSFVQGKAMFLMAGLPGHIVEMKKTVPSVRWMSLPRGPDYKDGNLNFVRESNYYAWTSTIGDDYADVVKASSWLFTSWDYNRWADADPNAPYDKEAWIKAQKEAGVFDSEDIEHIAELMYDQGTVVIKWPAWESVAAVVSDSIIRDAATKKDSSVTDAITKYKNSAQSALDSLLK